jgi:hypothetical protein
MVTLDLLLLVLAFLCFVLAALQVSARGVNLVAVGLAFWMLSLIV